MFEFYGRKPPAELTQIEVGGHCPHCKRGVKFIRVTEPLIAVLAHDGVLDVIIDYACTLCRKSIPIRWHVNGIDAREIVVSWARGVEPAKEPFNFDYVPDDVRKEIEEALDCLSVNAYNGFAAVCRRSIQAMCTNLGAGATTKVKQQIEDMVRITNLGKDWEEMAIQIMLSGHDGAHPHLPDMNAERARIMLSLLQDLMYQIYTRPGKIRESSTLREKAIEAKKEDSQ